MEGRPLLTAHRRAAVTVGLMTAAVVALVVVTAGIVMLGIAGANPFWRTVPVSMAEAAAARDRAELVRLIEAGGDPTDRMPVRAGILDDRPFELTPAEAAIRADRTEMLRILFAHGLPVDAETVAGWHCLALRVGGRETAQYLRERFAGWTSGDCTDTGPSRRGVR
jgi:hypothetical protein